MGMRMAKRNERPSGYRLNKARKQTMYPYLQCDADLLEGYVLPVEQIRAIGNFSNFLTRKLYIYNAAS